MITKQEQNAIKAAVKAFLVKEKFCDTMYEMRKRVADKVRALQHEYPTNESYWPKEQRQELKELREAAERSEEYYFKHLHEFNVAEEKAYKVCGNWIADMF